MIKQKAVHWSDQVICRLELPCCANAWQRENSNDTRWEYSERVVARGNLGARGTMRICKKYTCVSSRGFCASLICQCLEDLVFF